MRSRINCLSVPSFLGVVIVCTSLFLGRTSQADLVVNLTFDNSAAPADNSAILGGATLAQANAVIEHAADVWEAVFANSASSIGWSSNIGGTLTQDITVSWGSQSGSTLATGGTSFFSDGRWASDSGSLTFDNDGSSAFYVDAVPTDHSEWNQFSGRDVNFGGATMNAERTYYDAAAGVARSNADMLTVAIHEIGHALGFLNGYPPFSDSDIGSDGDIDITDGAFAGAEIAYASGHTTFELPLPAGGQFPYDPSPGSFVGLPANYTPNVMGSSQYSGTRGLLTEADIAIVAQYLQFDQATVNFNPQQTAAVPEPSGLAMFAIGVMALVGRRRRRTA